MALRRFSKEREQQKQTSMCEQFRLMTSTTRSIVTLNCQGIPDDESLISPGSGGNCLNWVLGHLLWAYDRAIPVLKQEWVFPDVTES
jgi:hypothetical protein